MSITVDPDMDATPGYAVWLGVWGQHAIARYVDDV